MPSAFEWAVLRVVPRVERGEFVNAGVLVYCQSQGFLGCASDLDELALLALDPGADVVAVGRHLDAVARACADDRTAGSATARSLGERFRWLVAPRSTVVQAGPVHTGVTDDPAGEVDRLLEVLVRRPRP